MLLCTITPLYFSLGTTGHMSHIEGDLVTLICETPRTHTGETRLTPTGETQLTPTDETQLTPTDETQLTLIGGRTSGLHTGRGLTPSGEMTHTMKGAILFNFIISPLPVFTPEGTIGLPSVHQSNSPSVSQSVCQFVCRSIR